MHKLQKKILDLASRKNIGSLTLREIGEEIGATHPQRVKHHLEQLFKKGFLKENKEKNTITRIEQGKEGELFYSIPILGSANCGQALTFAEEAYEGFLQVSKEILPKQKNNKYFAVKVTGNSMNRAKIQGKQLEEGDYAIVKASQGSPDFYNNKYVLSVINGMANIKKFKKDGKNQRLLLISESTKDYPPIVIHTEDFEDYLVNGHVVEVIKKP